MTPGTTGTAAAPSETAPRPPAARRRRRKARASLAAHGEPMLWLTGSALVLCLVMIVGLLGLILVQGSVTFWPRPVMKVTTYGGQVAMGEITREESYEPAPGWESELEGLSEEARLAARAEVGGAGGVAQRDLMRVGNFELSGKHFEWIDRFMVDEAVRPEWAVVVERLEWGRFYGFPRAYALVHHVDAGRLAARRRESRDAQRAAARTEAERVAAALEPSQGAAVEYLVERSVGGQDVRRLVPPDELDQGDMVIGVARSWRGAPTAWARYGELHDEVRGLWHEARSLEQHEVGEINALLDEARLRLKAAGLRYGLPAAWANVHGELRQARRREEVARDEAAGYLSLVLARYGESSEQYEKARAEAAAEIEAAERRTAEAAEELEAVEQTFGKPPPPYLDVLADVEQSEAEAGAAFRRIMRRIDRLERQMARHQIEMGTAEGGQRLIGLAEIVRAYPANQLDLGQKVSLYLSRWWEFLTADPREANSEGGVWPAIVGTVTMTMIMSLAVVPFGVLAALYLREYAKAGIVVSIVRIAINNLAGVPSIVFGVFGLGFFCYLVGGFIDGGPTNIQISPWPPARWWLLLGVTVGTGVAAFFLGIFGGSRRAAEVSTLQRWLRRGAICLWLATTALAILLIARNPHFDGFFRARLADNEPTFGTDGLLWASLTLALLTAPVVIVATEEALSAVPNSMREGSYACGASKWQTIRRIVLPRAMPGIMTGMILAIARGAGEVAPLMLVGAEKLAPALPVDAEFPFVHLDRTFMHLGFHIYDLGFQSPNAEAAKPMVFSTALLLIAIVAVLNIAAILLRMRLRRKFVSAQF